MDNTEQYQRFMSWQCRLRKLAMREGDGRPSAGMNAGVYSVNGGDEQARMNFLILHADPSERTAEFRQIVRKTQDPSQWSKKGLRILAERHYQDADRFEQKLTALFGLESSLGYALVKAGQCQLKFAEKSVEYAFDFDVESLGTEDELFQATYWHNQLFNPTLPGKVRVLSFSPRL